MVVVVVAMVHCKLLRADITKGWRGGAGKWYREASMMMRRSRCFDLSVSGFVSGEKRKEYRVRRW